MSQKRRFCAALSSLVQAGTPEAEQAIDRLVLLFERVLDAMAEGDQAKADELIRDFAGLQVLVQVLPWWEWPHEWGGPPPIMPQKGA